MLQIWFQSKLLESLKTSNLLITSYSNISREINFYGGSLIIFDIVSSTDLLDAEELDRLRFSFELCRLLEWRALEARVLRVSPAIEEQ